MDENQQTVIKVRGARYKSYLEQFLPPWNYAKQYLHQCFRKREEILPGLIFKPGMA